jgi:hypothetical protein
MLIQLKINCSLTNDQIAIKINGKSVPHKCAGTSIEIEVPLQFGLHQLIVESCTTQRFEIQKASIDHCDLRKLFYLAWSITAAKQRLQPCNELWEPGQQWILPFGYPVSDWIHKVESKFKNNVLGQDLYKDHWIWYPESTELDPTSPQIMQEFFKYNFDFTVVSKQDWSYEQIPFIKYTADIDSGLIAQAYHELKTQQDLIHSLNKNPGQQQYNFEEFGHTNAQQWQVLLLHRKASEGLTEIPSRYQEHFPAVWNLIDSLKIPYWYVFIGVMPPKSIVYPHRDDLPFFDINYKNYRGCTQLYIPLHWPDNSYIKLANAGTFDSSCGAMIINNDSFTHAAINNSTEYRYMLALRTTQEQISKFSIAC